jgi:2-polyprenyl-6-methoxyphenol hydroxylase-like FAD-dependent oxidoreductase
MVFTFGPNGFFGYSPSSSSEIMWWSTVQADDLPSQSRIALSDLRKQLKGHHGNWKDPFIQDVIKDANVEHVFPTWTTPELPYWSKDGLILVGDAAHALNPTSGQGSSQALEDAKTLSICLSRYLSQASLSPAEAIDRAGHLYYRVRQPRLHAIFVRTAKLANNKRKLSFVEEMMLYAFCWLFGRFPGIGKILLGDVNKELYGWDVYTEIKKALKRMGEADEEATKPATIAS